MHFPFAVSNRVPRKKTPVRIITAAMGALVLTSYCLLAAQTPLSAVVGDEKPQEKDDYIAGILGRTPIAIPKRYLLNRVVFSGEPRDGLGSSSRLAAPSSNIDNFSILLRLSDLSLPKTEAERDSWLVSMSKTVLFSKYWLMVQFDSRQKVPQAAEDKPSMIQIWGPFVRKSDNGYGLDHYVSIQEKEEAEQTGYGYVEYFYKKSPYTLIMCRSNKQVVRPFSRFTICTHDFFVDRLGVMAEAVYMGTDVNRWSEIEARVRSIADSFTRKP